MFPGAFADKADREKDMAAVTVRELSALTERESVYIHTGEAYRAAVRHLAMNFLAILIVIPLFITVAGLAQMYFYRMRRILVQVGPRLPNVTDRAMLELLRDSLRLALSAGRTYQHFTFSKKVAAATLEEMDETIDSINF